MKIPSIAVRGDTVVIDGVEITEEDLLITEMAINSRTVIFHIEFSQPVGQGVVKRSEVVKLLSVRRRQVAGSASWSESSASTGDGASSGAEAGD